MLARRQLQQRLQHQIRRYTSSSTNGISSQQTGKLRIIPFETVPSTSFSSYLARYRYEGSSAPPCRFEPSFFASKIPAFQKWFKSSTITTTTTTTTTGTSSKHNEVNLLNTKYLTSFGHDPELPVEVLIGRQEQQHQLSSTMFSTASLRLSELCAHINNSELNNGESMLRVYCAQLPPPDFLLDDVPPPFEHLGLEINKGRQKSSSIQEATATTTKVDIYSQALWLGTAEASKTPLHRDPNDNIFIQLSGMKRVRVFSPDEGANLLESCGAGDVAIARMRGDDMMVGTKARIIDEAVWSDGDEGYEGKTCHEAVVKPGDALFIPRGWWHAVRGVTSLPEESRGVVASVNWWFRIARSRVL